MAALSSAGPAAGPGRPPPDIDLDTHISLVEQRLMAREQRIVGHAHDLGRRVSRAAKPRALLLKVGGVALAGVGLVWMLRRGGAGAGGGRSASYGDAPPPHAGGLPQWVLSLLPMAWPLLPARWRGRISPSTAATVLGVAAPLIDRLLSGQGASRAARSAGPPTVAQVDLARYAGTWYEQARLPAPFEAACDGQASATYTPVGTRLAVHNECRSADGRLRAVDGVARVVPGSGGARLQVTFMPEVLHWLPFVWADLWILHVDESAQDYRVAIAGHPSRKGLWLLSRRRHLPASELQRLVALANQLGYDTDRLVLPAA